MEKLRPGKQKRFGLANVTERQVGHQRAWIVISWALSKRLGQQSGSQTEFLTLGK
jgi:hypothetical protein